MNTTKIITITCLAAIAGAVAGILLAPAKGSQTRSKISGKVNDLADDVKAKMHDLTNSFKKATERSKEWVDDIESSLS